MKQIDFEVDFASLYHLLHLFLDHARVRQQSQLLAQCGKWSL
jgi:hypothetical protein